MKNIAEVMTVDLLPKETSLKSERLNDRLFPSEKEAEKLQTRAKQGDDDAQARLASIYGQRYEYTEKQYSASGAMITRHEYPTIYSEGAVYWGRLARENSNLEFLPFDKAVQLGKRSAMNHLPVYAPEIHDLWEIKGTHFHYKADIVLERYGKLGQLDFIDNVGQKELGQLVAVIYQRVIPDMETCAKAGDTVAATELSRIADMTTWEKKQRGFFSDSTHKVSNPMASKLKAREWNQIAQALANPEKSSDLIERFFFNQDKTVEGLYNIGTGLLVHEVLANYYKNRHPGQPEPGTDFLKHAANLGNANAAWRLGRYYETHGTDGECQYWLSVAVKLGHPNAKARLAFWQTRHPDYPKQPIESADVINPSKAHMRLYPASVGRIVLEELDVSYLTDPTQGSIMERLERGYKDAEAQLKAVNEVIDGFEQKIFTLGVSAERKQELQLEAEQDQKNALHANTKIELDVARQEERVRQSYDRWKNEQVGYFATSALIGVATGGASLADSLKSGLPRAMSYRMAAHSVKEEAQDSIAHLLAGYRDISLTDGQIAELQQDWNTLCERAKRTQLIKDEATGSQLQIANMRRQLFHDGTQNCDILERYVQKEGVPNLDEFIEAFQRNDVHGVQNGLLSKSLSDFCFGFADTNAMHYILARADALKKPVTAEEKALVNFVEDHLKPTIDSYLSKASGVDVLKDYGLSLLQTKALSQSGSQSNHPIGQLINNKFSTTGQQYITDLFAFYLHRHGKRSLFGRDMNDGINGSDHAPKTLQVMSEDAKQTFIEQVTIAGRHITKDFPQPDNVFLRLCAKEYFEPQAPMIGGKRATFANNPQTPVSYPMVNDVINECLKIMSLFPIDSYQRQMKDKRQLDAVITQSFLDFFAILGQEHIQKFEKQRSDLQRAYDLNSYATRFDNSYKRLRDDAIERYALYQQVLERNLNKTLEISTRADVEALQEQILQVKEVGINVVQLENLIIPGSARHLELFNHQDRTYENMSRSPF